MRPKHWIKNILIFLPIVYSQNMNDTSLLLAVTACFAAFCLAASGIYVINDIFDYEKDRLHPVKKMRPIAAGLISRKMAALFAGLLIVAGLVLATVFDGRLVLLLLSSYVVLNLAYSYKLKDMAIIDCFCIAAGFVLRIYAGGFVIGENISEWLFLTITVGSLFMALGKRRGEMVAMGETSATRTALGNYNLVFLGNMVYVCAATTIVFYALWAMASTDLMIYTVPLFIFIICRYLLSSGESHGDPVVVIFNDKVLVVAFVVFGILSFALLYIV